MAVSLFVFIVDCLQYPNIKADRHKTRMLGYTGRCRSKSQCHHFLTLGLHCLDALAADTPNCSLHGDALMTLTPEITNEMIPIITTKTIVTALNNSFLYVHKCTKIAVTANQLQHRLCSYYGMCCLPSIIIST